MYHYSILIILNNLIKSKVFYIEKLIFHLQKQFLWVRLMKKESFDEEEIKVNKRRTDKVYFESAFIQSISDKIDFLREESKEILKELDSTEFKQQLDDFDLEEFSEDTINLIDDIFDDISRFKDDVIDTEDIPEDVKKHYRTTQMYLDRDDDYVRRAKRKLERLEAHKLSDSYETRFRAIELCDKAIMVNENNFDAHFLKAQTLVELKKYDEAIEEFIASLSIKDDIEVWLAIARANRLNGDLDDAINVYDKVLSKNKNSFEAFKGKAYTYFDLKDYKKANYFFNKANSIQPLDEASEKIWSVCKED